MAMHHPDAPGGSHEFFVKAQRCWDILANNFRGAWNGAPVPPPALSASSSSSSAVVPSSSALVPSPPEQLSDLARGMHDVLCTCSLCIPLLNACARCRACQEHRGAAGTHTCGIFGTLRTLCRRGSWGRRMFLLREIAHFGITEREADLHWEAQLAEVGVWESAVAKAAAQRERELAIQERDESRARMAQHREKLKREAEALMATPPRRRRADTAASPAAASPPSFSPSASSPIASAPPAPPPMSASPPSAHVPGPTAPVADTRPSVREHQRQCFLHGHRMISSGLRPIPPPCLGCGSKASWGLFWASWGPLGASWEPLGARFWGSWAHFWWPGARKK